MATSSKSNRPQRTGSSDNKSAKSSTVGKDNDYPNIVEEPIRVVGDQTRGKSRAGKTKKQSAKREKKKLS
jgi:hypothetical protein